MLQMLREKCWQLEDDVHTLNGKLKQAQDIIDDKDECIQVCEVVVLDIYQVVSEIFESTLQLVNALVSEFRLKQSSCVLILKSLFFIVFCLNIVLCSVKSFIRLTRKLY